MKVTLRAERLIQYLPLVGKKSSRALWVFFLKECTYFCYIVLHHYVSDILFEPVKSGHLTCHALRFRRCEVDSCDVTPYGCVTMTMITLYATEGFPQHWPLVQFSNLKICLKITVLFQTWIGHTSYWKNSVSISFSSRLSDGETASGVRFSDTISLHL